MPYLIIRTEPRRELSVYRACIEAEYDAWLPLEFRFTQPGARHREWRGNILPGMFFAAIPFHAVRDLHQVNGYLGVVTDGTGAPIEIHDLALLAFKQGVERENAIRDRMMRVMMSSAQDRGRTRRNRISARIRRRGRKAAELKKWANSLK